MRAFLLILLLVYPACSHFGASIFQPKTSRQSDIADRCFCDLKGTVDECECSIDFVDKFNNAQIYPRLRSLLAKDYFRFFKVNFKKPCPFWADDGACSLKFCAVQPCTDDNVPPGIRQKHAKTSFGPENKVRMDKSEKECDQDLDAELGYLNTTLSVKVSEDIARWTAHDEASNSFCDVDDEENGDSVYVDLKLNPERYTGYKGESAQRIWKAIYEENCFKPKRGYGPYIDSSNVGDLCLEKRAFYRAVSGLHTSINIHLCADYLHGHGDTVFEVADTVSSGNWGPNPAEFQRRFDPELTNGEGPKRLRNLYFLYLLELRALAKAAPFLEHYDYFTGDEGTDEDTKLAISDLLTVLKNFKPHFNESTMFNGGRQALKLKEEFRHHFRNITRIMDCVGCEKCKLWGKLQTQGLGTALKILFSGTFDQPDPTAFDWKSMQRTRFQLSRNEIVALLNAFGRLSHSIYSLESFRQMTSVTT
nr:EOG090X03A4 [Eulimnadia texana]